MTSITDRLRPAVGATYGDSSRQRSGQWLELVSFATRVRQFLLERSPKETKRFVALKAACHEKLWISAAAGAGASIEDLGHGVHRIARGGRETFVSASRVMLDGPVTLKIAGNKPLVSQILSEHGHPVGRFLEFDLSKIDLAETFLTRLGCPAVVKPAESGSGGRGITTGVETRRDLRRASILASTYSRTLLIEQQATGASYRLLYLDGEFIDAIERRPPRVVGDGRHSLERLIRMENRRRLAGSPPLGVQPLVIDLELKRCLARQGLALSSVPAAGEWVIVKAVVNDNTAAENSNVRDRVHPETIRRGAEIARLLKIRFAGHDVITTDISRPLEVTGGIFNEVNTTPGLLHHYLVDNPEQSVPVMQRLLDVLLGPGEWPPE
jgi:D-alanine-D-alanine ligase-like ATP-grasp enzyme